MTMRSLRSVLTLPALLAAPFVSWGCGDNPGGAGSGATPDPAATSETPTAPKSNPAIKEVMVKLGKGPDAMTPAVGRELKADPTLWDAIQPQAKDYARLAVDLVKEEPGRGDKESWTRLASAFASLAAELDKAAQAKDRDAALVAHGKLSNSCMECHRAHRATGPGGPGGPPPSGGPPPGRPPM